MGIYFTFYKRTEEVGDFQYYSHVRKEHCSYSYQGNWEDKTMEIFKISFDNIQYARNRIEAIELPLRYYESLLDFIDKNDIN